MDGVLIINKTAGMTSHDVCAAVKRRFGFRKVGHTGTLDPLATGVLPVCVNEATKLVQFLMQTDKEYCCTMRLGVTTDTHDADGRVLARCADMPHDPDDIRRALHAFRGEILQTPPMFSALKHRGTPLYKLARAGMTVDRQERRITVSGIELVALQVPDVVFRVVCSSGTYVRTLCHDIGQRLGCGAHMTGLERIRSGSFHCSRSVTLEELDALPRDRALALHMIPIRAALSGLAEVVVGGDVERKLRTGAPVTRGDLCGCAQPAPADSPFKVLSRTGQLIAVVTALPEPEHDGMPAWKTLRVFADAEQPAPVRNNAY